MLLKLEFYDKSKNTEAWWNRLWDRFNTIKDKTWTVTGGGCYGQPSVEFKFTYKSDGKLLNDQKAINEVVWIFVLEQINVQSFYLNGKDITKPLQQR